MIGTICVECQAQSPNLPLYPWTAYVNSPSSIRIRNVPKKIGSWCITRVYVSVVYPDGQIKTADCVPVGGVYVGTVAGAGVSGTTENGYTVFADGTDENGASVTGYILGRGNVTILDDDGILKPDAKRYYVRMLSADTENHFEGDLYRSNGTWYIWQDGQSWSIGDDSGKIAELSAKVETKADLSVLDNYVTTDDFDEAISVKADLSALNDVADDLAELENGLSDYYTKSETSSNVELDAKFETKADLSAIPTKTSQLSNDSDFITSRQVQPYNTLIGYAKNSLGSLFLFGRSSSITPNENTFVTIDFNNSNKLTQVERTYPSWLLSQFETTTFDPPLEMRYRYVDTYMWRVGARTYRQYIGSNCWVASSGTNCYYIKADEDGNALPVFYVKSVEHPITFDQYEKSIETMDGEAGNIVCTRTSTLPVTVSQKYVAYEDDVSAALSAKADLSAIHGDYIEDAIGNRINANLSCTYIDDTAWEITDPSSNKHILEYVGFIQSYHTWECVEPENIKLVLTYANDWELQVFTWQEIGPGGDHDWVLDINCSYNGDSDITTIPYFVNATTTYNYSAQRPVTKHLTLATKEYVDSRLSALEARIAALEGN